MTKQMDRKNLAAVKQALSDKYTKMADATASRPRETKYRNKSTKYRQQAENLNR